MGKYISVILTAVVVITLSVLGFVLGGFSLSEVQKETQKMKQKP